MSGLSGWQGYDRGTCARACLRSLGADESMATASGLGWVLEGTRYKAAALSVAVCARHGRSSHRVGGDRGVCVYAVFHVCERARGDRLASARELSGSRIEGNGSVRRACTVADRPTSKVPHTVNGMGGATMDHGGACA
jgi:hypothetical protein